MNNDFCGARYYYNPYYPYNTLEEKHKFLETYKECVDILVAINHIFPGNKDKLFDLISKLYVEPIGNQNIIIRYNDKTIYNTANIKYVPFGSAYKIALDQAFNDDWIGEISLTDYCKILSNIDELKYNNPKPKLKDARLNIFDSKIIFEIETSKDGNDK